MQFQVLHAQTARTLPPRDGFAPKRVDWLTLRAADGGQYLASAFVGTDTTLPAPGQTVDGELGDPDPIDKDRRRFRAGGTVQQAAPPSAPAPPSPTAPASVTPTGVAYGERVARDHRIERQHSQEMALRYAAIVAAQDGLTDTFGLRDVFALTSAFENDLNPPHPAAADLLPAAMAQQAGSGTGIEAGDVEYAGESQW